MDFLHRLLDASVTVPFEASQERFPHKSTLKKGGVPGSLDGGWSAVHHMLVLKLPSLHHLSLAHPQAFSDGLEQGPVL